MKRFILIMMILASVMTVCAAGGPGARKVEAERLRNTLPAAENAEDSIRILYDIFDLSIEDARANAGYEILEIAKRKGDTEVIFDIIPQLAGLKVRDRAALDGLLLELKKLPESDRQKAVELFVKVEQTKSEARYLSAEQRHEALREYFKEDMTPKFNIYEDILDLYRVVIFIRHTTQGNLYLEYLTRLENLISELPADNRFLKNLFYTTAANYYANNDFPEKSIEADRKLLDLISELEKSYREKGRKHRNYDRYYYICYRRMLSNYEALDLEEVKDLYTRCARLAERDEEVAESFYGDGRATAYRLMAEKDYAGALPYLQKALSKTDDKLTRSTILPMLIEAADSVNDQNAMLVALKEYTNLLSESRRHRSEDAVIELRMRYDVNQLRSEKSDLEIQKKDIEIDSKQKVISVTLASLLVVVIFLMLLYRSHFKLLSKSRNLDEQNKKLHKTIEGLLDDGTPQGTRDVRSSSPEGK